MKVQPELRRFFERVSSLHEAAQLEEQEREAARTRAAKPAARRKRWNPGAIRVYLLAIGSIVAVGMWVVQSLRPQPLGRPILPESIHGRWETNNPKYRHRGFWISWDKVAFQTGPLLTDYTIAQIEDVVARPSLTGDTTYFTVNYRGEEGRATWAFAFAGKPKPAIRFSHQKEIEWRPGKGEGWPRN
ncbi:MAG: hypothetical protein HOP28_11320 [Gemmatimonadales bacterium]|nr:hypothetical protein [Gemmatimonadales bacterium]